MFDICIGDVIYSDIDVLLWLGMLFELVLFVLKECVICIEIMCYIG